MNNIHMLLRYGFAGYIFLAIVLSFCYFVGILLPGTTTEIFLKTDRSTFLILFSGFPLGAILHWMYYSLYKLFGWDNENMVLWNISEQIGIKIDKNRLSRRQRRILRLVLEVVTEYTINAEYVITREENISESVKESKRQMPTHKETIHFMFSRLHFIGNVLIAVICGNVVNFFLCLHKFKSIQSVPFIIIGITSTLICMLIWYYRIRAKECLIMYKLDYIYKHKDEILGNIKQLSGISIEKDSKGNEIIKIEENFIESISFPLMRWKDIMFGI